MTDSSAHGGGPDLRRRSDRRSDGGFTLVELIIVVAITPLIIGAIAVGLVQIFSLQGTVSNRLQNSVDTQVINTALSKDVENSAFVTTDASSTSPTPCGSGTFTQLLGLQWNGGTDVVTYATVANGTATTVNLVRNYCQSGSLTSSSILAYNVSVSQGVPSVTCLATYSSCVSSTSSSSGTASSGWLTSTEVKEVSFSVSEVTTASQGAYSFTLAASPVQNLSTDPATLGGPTAVSECGFALAGTGTYAAGQPQQLCFLDFSFLNDPLKYSEAETNGLSVSEGVPGGYTISFTVKVSTGPVVAGTPFPTWQYAFMGNDVGTGKTPFYTGVGCPSSYSTTTATGAATPSCIDPAIYEPPASNGQTTYVTMSNFSVVTSDQKTQVTGYEVVSTDAETTDANESITWNVTSPGLPYLFHLIPNSPTSPIGNACNSLTSLVNGSIPTTTPATNDLSGMDLTTDVSFGQTVKCQTGFSTPTPRTGTTMLGFFPVANDAPTLNVTLQGSGLEGVDFALLLPG